MTLPVSLLLVGVGYVLLVAGPLLTARISPLLAPAVGGSTGMSMPAAASAGIALLGAAAMVLVLARLVRDVETRPYAAIAPVLAVFSAFLLTSARAKLPFPEWASEHLGMFVLTLALLGGSLIGRMQAGARALGWLLVFFPFGAVLTAFALATPGGSAVAFGPGQAQAQTYFALLGMSALALGFAGRVARTLMPSSALMFPDIRLPQSAHVPEPTMRVPLHATQLGGYGAPARAPTRPRDSMARQSQHGLRGSAQRADWQQGGAQSLSFDTAFDASFDDQAAIALMKPKRSGKLLLTICMVGGALASLAAYFYAQPSHTPPSPVAPAVERAQPKVEAPPTVTTEQLPVQPEAKVEPVVAPEQPAADIKPVVTPTKAPVEREARSADHEARAVERAANDEEREARKAARAEKRRIAAEEREAAAAAALQKRTEEGEAKRAAKAAAREQAQASEAAERSEAESAKPAASKPAAPAKPAPVEKEAPPSANERDLDLDSLVHKALKNSNGVSAADDPLLGL